MTFAPAPFHRDSARAPDDAAAHWVTAEDGVRLRVGVLGRGVHGTILLLPGRTEYLEKYGLAAAEFAARGLSVATIDFRGQGLSDRPLPDPDIGHVASFDEYQRDLRALMSFAADQGLPKPWTLLAHSMGGNVGLRGLLNGLDVQTAIFSAPMWGIRIPDVLRPLVYGLGWLSVVGNRPAWLTPGTSRRSYVRSAKAQGNLLTNDADMIAYLRGHLDAVPEMNLGGPSLTWLYRALKECRALQAAAPPDMPALVFLPTGESVVDPRATRRILDRWPQATRVTVSGSRHEVMMETPERRRLFFDRSIDFIAAQGAPALAGQ